MKKVLILIAAAFISFAANAQFYAGGSLSLELNDYSYFNFNPEVGYALNETFSVGAAVQFETRKDTDVSFEFAPYLRWNLCDFGPFKFFVDGQVVFATYNDKIFDNQTSSIRIGAAPGFAFPVNDKLSFVSHVGWIGYTSGNGVPWYTEGFGIYCSSYDVSFGAYYNF